MRVIANGAAGAPGAWHRAQGLASSVAICHPAIGGLTKASGVALAIFLTEIKLARGCRWNRRDIFVERQFGFLPNAGVLGVARFAFLLIGLRFLGSRPLRLRQ